MVEKDSKDLKTDDKKVNHDEEIDYSKYSIGVISLTGGKTSEWYKENLSNGKFHFFFDELESNLNWDVKLLIICAHGRKASHKVKGVDKSVDMDEIMEFIKKNIKYQKIYLNVCQGGNCDDTPGESLGNHVSLGLNCKVYAALEKIKAYNGKNNKFFDNHEYTWHRYTNNSKSNINGKGIKTIRQLIHFLYYKIY